MESGLGKAWRQEECKKFLNLENKPGICVSVSFVEVELLLADESLVPWKICHLRH